MIFQKKRDTAPADPDSGSERSSQSNGPPSAGKRRRPSDARALDGPDLSRIADWMKEVRFQKKLFGGVDERNVWRKIQELDRLYAEALEAERVRYDTLILEYKKTAAHRIEAVRKKAGQTSPNESG